MAHSTTGFGTATQTHASCRRSFVLGSNTLYFRGAGLAPAPLTRLYYSREIFDPASIER
jgi:hypothetical protein